MQIIISPAKKMNADCDGLDYKDLPARLDITEKILDKLKSITVDELQALWKVNDAILKENISRLEHFDATQRLSVAIESYVGLQYQSLGNQSLTEAELSYLQERLYILSAFYGYLRPFDGIRPYRLEMQAKLQIENFKNLYELWQEPYSELFNLKHQGEVIVNLASREYSKAVVSVIDNKDRIVNISFVEPYKDGFKEKATLSKMCRGAMVRFCAEHNVESIDEIKEFDLGYSFDEKLSSTNNLVFVKQ